MDMPRTELTKALVRDGLRRAAAGTAKRHGIGDGASAGESAHLRQSAARGGGIEQPMGIKLVWANATAIRKSAGKHAPFRMIEGGKR